MTTASKKKTTPLPPRNPLATRRPRRSLRLQQTPAPAPAPSPPPHALLRWLQVASQCVHRGLEGFFGGLAERVVAHPLRVVVGVVVLTLLLAQGVWFFKQETDGMKLFSPEGTRSKREEEYVTSMYRDDGRTMSAYFFSSSGVLTPEAFVFAQAFYAYVTEDAAVEYENKVLRFPDICTASFKNATHACKKPRSPLTVWDHDAVAVASLNATDLLDGINNASLWQQIEPTGAGVWYYVSEAGRTYSDAVPPYILSAHAFQMTFYLKNVEEGGEQDPETDAFELHVVDRFIEYFKPVAASHGFDIELRTRGEQTEAAKGGVAADINILVAGYLLLLLYVCCTLGDTHAKYSHSVLGLVSVVSVAMATMSSYGLCWLIGLEFNGTVQVLVLLLLGVGVDDTFVIIDSWNDVVHISDMKERMVAALKHAGPAVTITSLTDMVAFLAGATTEIPALRVFCYYAALGVMFDFVYQVTFFVAVAYLDTEREAASRRDVLCCITVHETTPCIPCPCGAPPPDLPEVPTSKVIVVTPTPQRAPQSPVAVQSAPRRGKHGCLHTLVGEMLPRMLLKSTSGKVVVVMATCFLLTLAVVGCTKVRMNYNNDWFIPSGHRFNDAMDVRDTYFGGSVVPAMLYTEDLDYASIDTQTMLNEACSALEDVSWVVNGTVASWLPPLIEWVEETRPEDLWFANHTYINPDRFYSCLVEYLHREETARDVLPNLVWKGGVLPELEENANGSTPVLLSSRIMFVIGPGPLSDGGDAVDCLSDLREAMDAYHCFAYSKVFVFWESYRFYKAEAVRSVLISAACVFVLVTLLTANPLIGVLVLLSVGGVDLCMVGFMTYVGVDINAVSVLCIVLAVGLAVDYSVHIAGSFLLVSAVAEGDVDAKTRRAGYALWKTGPAVVNGALSTLIAVLPLAAAQSYIFVVFFRMFILIIFFGLWFGVFVLPVLLSWVGPEPNTSAKSLVDHPEMDPLSSKRESQVDAAPKRMP